MTTRSGTAMVAVLAAAVIALAWPLWPALSVTPDGAAPGYLPVSADERFGLTFEHSVDHLPIEDWYHVESGSIVQDSTRLRQFGAGMGHIDGTGTGRDAGDWWEIVDMNRMIGDLVVRVGSARVDHRLVHPGGVLPLSRCWAGKRVTISPVRLSTVERVTASLRSPEECEHPDDP